MPTKLAPHIVPEHMDFAGLSRWQPKSVKIVGFDLERCKRAYEACPSALMILRNHPISEQHEDMFRDPEGTGRRHAEELASQVERSRGAIPLAQIAVSGINEPHVWDAGGVAVTVRYYVAFLDRLRELGLRGGALNLSVGWPANTGTDTPPDWAPFAPVRDAILRGGHYLILHEYWDGRGPDFNWGWWAGRYEKCPWVVPIIIGECGIDRYVSDPSVGLERRGWNGTVMPDVYMQQLARYDERLRADPRIHSAQIFTYDFAHPWESFDVRPIRDRIIAHAEAIRNVPDPVARPVVVDPPPPQPTASPLAAALKAAFGAQFADLTRQLPSHATLKYDRRDLAAVDTLIVHHSGTADSATWAAVANWHVANNQWPGIGYHIGIMPDGKIALLNEPETVAYHAGDMNGRSVGICVIGTYVDVSPNPASLDTLRKCVQVLDTFFGRKLEIGGHSDYGSTACPGAKLLEHVRTLRPAEPAIDVREQIRAAAWQSLGADLHPDWALIRKARAAGLGAPLGPEQDTAGWRWQPYSGGIVGAPLGKWDEAEVLNW